jgi:hypothetical protein
MLSPVSLSERLIFRQKLMGTLTLEILHRARHRQMRRNRQQQMHVISVYRPRADRHFMAQSYFPQQLPRPKPDITVQNRISILRHPNNVIFAIPDRMTARFRRVHHRMLCIPSPKGEGFTDPRKGTLKGSIRVTPFQCNPRPVDDRGRAKRQVSHRLEAKFSSKRTTGEEVRKSSNLFDLDQKTCRSLE